MKYYIISILCLIFLCTQSYAVEYGKLHETSGIFGRLISFDEDNNAWFGCESGLYKVPNGTDSLIKINEFRVGSQTIKLNYSLDDLKGSPFICFAGKNKILGLQNEIYLIKKAEIIRIDTLIDRDGDLHLRDCSTIDNKTFWIVLRKGLYTYIGLYHFDPETLTWENYPWASDGRGYPTVHLNSWHITKNNDYYWYPGSSSELTFFNKDTAGRINLEALMQDSVAFSLKKEGFFCGSFYYFSGFDNKIYQYNLDTGELISEDLTNTIVYTENQDILENIQSARIRLLCVTDEFKVVGPVCNDSPRFRDIYFRKAADSVYHRVDVDTTKIKSFMRVFADAENNLWAMVTYDNEDNNPHIHPVGYIRFDPLAPGTSVEETESMPTVQATKIYPNPTKKTATVRFFLNPNFRDNVKFEIYDYMGRKVKALDNTYSYDQRIAFGTKTIDVVGIETGAYYLVIDNGNEKRSIGFLVE